MKLEIIKSKTGTYKIISRSSKSHPVLTVLGELLKYNNKTNPVKIGVYSVTGGEFERRKRVKSYISGSVESMDKKNFYKWLSGKKQIKNKARENLVLWDKDADKDADKNFENIIT